MWEIPKTFIAGKGITAADLNTFVRDNQLEMAVNNSPDWGMLVTAGKNLTRVNSIQNTFMSGTATYTTNSTTPVRVGAGVTTVVEVEHEGAMLILYMAKLRARGTTGIIQAAPEVFDPATNNTVVPATLARTLRHSAQSTARFGGHVLHYNIPPGRSGVRMMHWVNSANTTCETSQVQITVIPL